MFFRIERERALKEIFFSSFFARRILYHNRFLSYLIQYAFKLFPVFNFNFKEKSAILRTCGYTSLFSLLAPLFFFWCIGVLIGFIHAPIFIFFFNILTQRAESLGLWLFYLFLQRHLVIFPPLILHFVKDLGNSQGKEFLLRPSCLFPAVSSLTQLPFLPYIIRTFPYKWASGSIRSFRTPISSTSSSSFVQPNTRVKSAMEYDSSTSHMWAAWQRPRALSFGSLGQGDIGTYVSGSCWLT